MHSSSIPVYSILYYSILFYSILFYSILLYAIPLSHPIDWYPSITLLKSHDFFWIVCGRNAWQLLSNMLIRFSKESPFSLGFNQVRRWLKRFVDQPDQPVAYNYQIILNCWLRWEFKSGLISIKFRFPRVPIHDPLAFGFHTLIVTVNEADFAKMTVAFIDLVIL